MLTALLVIALAADPSKSVATGNNAFSLELYSKLATQPGNVFFSPYSISSALGMTWAGARGTTAEEMAKTLHFTPETHAGLAALNQQLIGKKTGYQLSVANRLYAAKFVKLLEPFTKLAKDQYGAPVELVDFNEDTRKRVNTWVEDQTNQRIKDLIPAGVFNSDTRLALINAIYFKGTWAKKFDKKETKTQPFFSNGKKKDVPLMFAKLETSTRVRYGQTPDAQVLELPYQGGEVTMIIVLPTARDGLPALEKKLDSVAFDKLLKTLHSTGVDVWLPRFKVEQQLELGSTLASLGMPSAFSASSADFTGMTAEKGLFISAVIHKAFVEVNEEGTEAAAATGVVMGIESVQQTASFRADHPFLFALRDSKSGAVLFLGRLVDPSLAP
jgi:serpin B